jgi:hypothetical protein
LTSWPDEPQNARMTEPDDRSPPATAKSGLRWYQFRLRALLVAITLIVGLLVAWRQLAEPYRRQRETMKLVQDLGGEFQTAEAAVWQRAIFGADFQNVTAVSLPDCDEPDQYLARVAALPRLEALAVGGLNFTDEHLRRLRDCKALQVLVLDSTSVTADEIAGLQRDLPQTRVYQSQRRAIAAMAEIAFVYLRDVDALGESSGPPEVATWFGSLFFERAEGLRWSRGPGKNDLANLAYLRCLSELENIWLKYARNFDDSLVVHFRGLNRLESLDLSHTNISDAALAEIGKLHSLKMLHLDGTQISDAGLAHLGGLSELVRLDLNLNGTRITDGGLKHLRQLPNLGMLRLDSTRVTDAGLIELGRFPALRGVFARGNNISRSAKGKLQAALPECFICIE